MPNETPKGTAVAELGLAIKRVWTDNEGAAPQKREEATFVDVTLWARLAEIAQQCLKKGSPVFIEVQVGIFHGRFSLTNATQAAQRHPSLPGKRVLDFR